MDLVARYDKHADYTTRFGDRSYTDDISLWGISKGLQLKYFHPVTKNLSLSLGAGYHLLCIDKIRNTTPWSDNVSARTIDFTHPTGIEPGFNADKYRYNSVTWSFGLNYKQVISAKTHFNFGGDYTYMHMLSQKYHITYDDITYKTSRSMPLGFAVNANAGILRRFGKKDYYFNPKLQIAIYQQLNGDQAFRETPDLKMTKWFQGVGCSLGFGKFF
ncbi:MAG: hypothetical protein ABW036_00565 [Flavitalea sp.]